MVNTPFEVNLILPLMDRHSRGGLRVPSARRGPGGCGQAAAAIGAGRDQVPGRKIIFKMEMRQTV